MTVEIGFAATEDLPQLADLLAELFTLESDFRPDRDKQSSGLQLILDNPALGRLFVLRRGEQVLGMANALVTVSTAEGGYVLLLEDVIVRMTVGEANMLLSRITRRSRDHLGLIVGMYVCAQVKSVALM